MKYFLLGTLLSLSLVAQTKNYTTDQLKALKRVSADQWRGNVENATSRSSTLASTTKGTTDYLSQQLGYTILKYNQTVDLKAEVLAVFEGSYSAGQSATGASGTRNPKAFKIGPGKYDIKDGTIIRSK